MTAISRGLSAISLVFCVLGVATVAHAQELRRLPALVHVHSTLSTGAHSIESLVTLAKDQGIEAILLAENFVLRVDYGPLPFHVKVVEYPSVLQVGVEQYLDEVARVQRRHPDVLLLPGVEVIPYYYWTGSLLTGDLTHHDLQKNLLIFGVTNPEDLRRLPVIGNRWNGRYEWRSVLLLAPGLLLVFGLVLLLRTTERRERMGRFMVVRKRRRSLLGGALTLAGVFWLGYHYPFTVDPLLPSGPSPRLTPHQALIDYVRAKGGVSVWSLPEARDRSSHSLMGLSVRLETEPYPDDLIKTDRYTAFGAIYDQPTRLTMPGERWDYLIGKFVNGQRESPGWAIGETAYHSQESGKKFGGIQTVFWVKEKSAAAVIESFRLGRFYALQKASTSLVLEEWSVSQSGAVALSGGRLKAKGAAPIEVKMAVTASDGRELPVRLALLRGGELAASWSGTTPFRMTFKDAAAPSRGYYRLEVRGPSPARIVSNPIFIEAARQ